MWALSDVDTPILAKEFYKYMFRNGVDQVNIRDSAKALQVAVDALKKIPQITPNRWIQLVHIGV